jgi:hypothetical protein
VTPPRKSVDIRAATAATLAIISLVGTIVAGMVHADREFVTLLGGFTTTFGAYALGIQSETRT